MKIAICASEVVPFAKTGGLADVTGALPLALEELGEKVIVIMPGYRAVHNPKFKITRTGDDISYSEIGKGVRVYFIENRALYDRDALYGDKTGDYPDNLERFSYYSRRALSLLKEIKFDADIIHVHDWQACAIPVYLRTMFRDHDFYRKMRTLLTIHNIGYQGLFPKEEFPKLGLDWQVFSVEGLEYYGKINLLKGGILFSDIINTVSPSYSFEIQTKEFGYGMEGVLDRRRNALFGILNGLDYSIWNPATDKQIAKTFDISSIGDKVKDKLDIQKFCGLHEDRDVPLLGIVSRLAEQKGLDILSEAMEAILRLNVQLVILGTGDAKYHELLTGFAKRHPRKMALYLKFDDALAHKIYAGSDIFLMPSKYEPCGLGQMISMRYGTLPLVYKTGGLADTVTPESGYIFDNYSAEALFFTLKEALGDYKNRKLWISKVEKAMKANFSWKESAKKYVELYKKAKG